MGFFFLLFAGYRQNHQRAERIGRSHEISDLMPRFFASGEVTG